MDFNVMVLFGIILIVSFIFLSGLHFYWAFGGKLGIAKAIPSLGDKPVLAPSKVVTLIIALGLIAIAAEIFLLVFPISFLNLDVVSHYTAYGLAAIFILRAIGDFKWVGLFKKQRDSEFARMDSFYYSPFCFLVGVYFLIINFFG